MRDMIRAYRKDDYDAVVALVTNVLAEYGFSAHIGGVQSDLAAIEDGYSRGGFWVAEIEGAVAGTVASAGGMFVVIASEPAVVTIPWVSMLSFTKMDAP